MNEWRRNPSDTLCGYCGEQILTDAPALFTKLPNVKRERVRCVKCAGEAPPDLPARIVRSPMTKRMQPIGRAIPIDYRNLALGERE